jgi:acetamidase/formamidase
MLSSVAADLPVTQVVDGNKGVHMTIAKPIFTKAR